MPIKKVRELKDKTDRGAGMEWARALNIPDLKTDEWEYAAMLASEGLDDLEIRQEILERRK